MRQLDQQFFREIVQQNRETDVTFIDPEATYTVPGALLLSIHERIEALINAVEVDKLPLNIEGTGQAESHEQEEEEV